MQTHRAIKEGTPITGYFAWSFMDNFEWIQGYRPRFGLVYTECASQRRYIKACIKLISSENQST